MPLGTLCRRLGLRSRPRRYTARTAEGDYSTSVRQQRADVQTSMRQAGLSNPFCLYQDVITRLSETAQVTICPMNQLADADPSDSLLLGLRHDVDADLPCALECARLLAQLGLPGAFYLLHSSHYYGHLSNGCFHRSADLPEFIVRLIVAGCEIGLHIDPFYFFGQGVDGIEAVRVELDWLRRQGAIIDGVCAHNSAAAYGTESFEIFAQCSSRSEVRLLDTGVRAPLRTLRLSELGLSYEANFPLPRRPLNPTDLDAFLSLSAEDPLRNRPWAQVYFCDHPIFDRDYDYSIWLIGRDRWLVAGHREHSSEFLWNLATKEMLRWFQESSNVGKKAVMTIHPVYLEPENGSS